jgi:hypothetical protein
MAQLVIGAAIALFVGMQLARQIDSSKGARADYKKAKAAVPAARKKAYGATMGFTRFIVIVGVVLVLVAYGWASSNN